MKQHNTVLCLLLISGISFYTGTSAFAIGRGAFADDSVGARASVLGEAFVAVADDASALRWNPAGITQLLQPEFTMSHINFFSMGGYVDYAGDSGSINEDFIGVAWPTRHAPVGISLLNTGIRGMNFATEGGAILDYASYAERILTLSAGKRVEAGGFGLSGGLNLNGYFVNAHSNSAGFGADVGLLLEMPGILPELGVMLKGLFMDTTLVNNGPTIPARADLGIAFSPFRPLKLVGGLSKISGDSMTQYSTGVELVFFRFSPLSISFLAGYRTLGTLEVGSSTADGSHQSVGFSARLWRYKLDYAYEQHSVLGDTHRVTFGFFQSSPENYHLRKGREAFERLDNDAAMAELNEVLYLVSRDAEVHHLLALTYERMRQKDETIRILEKIQSFNYDYFMENNLDQMIKDVQEQE